MLTETELLNAERDVADLAAVVNGLRTDPDIVTRTGTVVKPLAKVLYLLATTVLTPPDYIGPKGDPGGNVMAIGLLTGAAGMDTGGADLVQTSGNVVVGVGEGRYAKDDTVDLVTHPKAGFTNSAAHKFRILRSEPLVPQKFIEATDPDWQNAFDRMLAYEKSLAGNRGVPGGGFEYSAGQPILIPGGQKYALHATLEFRVNLIVEGEGSGRGGPGAHGNSCLQFPDGIDWIRTQAVNTSGQNDVDGVGHDGSSGVYLRHLMLEGPNSGTVAPFHAIVPRNPIFIEDIYVYGCQGIALRMWTGNVDGNYLAGQLSLSEVFGFKGEHCQGTLSIRGTDSSLITTRHIEGYQNRQFGFFDQCAAGSNTHDNPHMTYNGFSCPAAGPFPRCSYMGNIYTPRIGAWNFGDDAASSALMNANPPSGTTDSNAYWCYQYAGGPSAISPAFASGGPWIWGGDMFTATPQAITINDPYMEGGGGFSQFDNSTLLVNGQMDSSQFVGGCHWKPRYDGMVIDRTGGAALILRAGTALTGGSCGVSFRNMVSDHEFGSITANEGGQVLHVNPSGQHFYIWDGVTLTDIGSLDYSGLALGAGRVLSIAGVPVITGQMAALADLAAAPTMADFNTLLARLRSTSLMHA